MRDGNNAQRRLVLGIPADSDVAAYCAADRMAAATSPLPSPG